MRLLLDTQAFLWFVWNDARLSGTARQTIENSGNSILVSAATVWEIAIKVSTGKLSIGQDAGVFLESQLAANDMTLLPITIPHAARVALLPFHHKDPFDRLLIAQSLVDGVALVSNDSFLNVYGVQRLW